MRETVAVVAITKHGTGIARRLLSKIPRVDVYYPEKFRVGDEQALGIHTFPGSVVAHVPALFSTYDGIVGIFSLGAMVRLISPLLRDKKTDPAIVVIDDRAEFVISVLSGHLGGANDLTREVAMALGAQPVITTASDVGQTLAVDLLGRRFGWTIANFEQVTGVSAAVVNEERIALIQESGERNWWEYDKALPPYITVYSSLSDAVEHVFDATLVITHRILRDEEVATFLRRGVLYRPRVLVLGIGCNRGTSKEEIESAICSVLAEANLSVDSVRNIATIDLKADEQGLLELCAKRNWPLVTYPADVLNQIDIPHPSEKVYEFVGAYGVAEPAAKASSGAEDWIVEKCRMGNVTVSVCLTKEECL